MMCQLYNGIAICGGTPALSKKRPENWIDTGYTIVKPFDFKWRAKLGRATCDCKEIIESYQPYYGFTWRHSKECAIIKHIKKYPGIQNLLWEVDPEVIAMSD